MHKNGIVVNIRINPTDAMSVVDILDHLGIPKDNLSFPQATKLVLGAFLATARRDGLVPVRTIDGYEDVLAPFQRDNFNSRASKLKVTENMSMPILERG